MSATEQLVSFVCKTNYDQLPEEAIRRAKDCLLDGLGVMIAGCRHPASELMLNYARDVGGRPKTTIVGSGFKTSANLAALVNGTMCHVMDFDDTNRQLRGHPTTVLLPTILAVGEELGAGGSDLLTAYILGFEVNCEIARYVNPAHYLRGYHATSSIGIFGALTAAAKLLKLTPMELSYAYGICGSRSAGLRSNFGTMTKALHAGMAAHDAISAAMLGKRRYTACLDIFNPASDLWQVMSPKPNEPAPFQTLGNPWNIVSSGVVFKKYPSCARTHAAIDATLYLINENHIRPSEIKKIMCGTDKECFNILIYPRPQNGLEAKFSIPYCLARVCLDGNLNLDDFLDKSVQNPRVQAMMNSVTHYVEPEIVQKGPLFRAAAKIIIELENGQTLAKTLDKPKWNSENPPSFEKLTEKFRMCVQEIIDDDCAEKVIPLIDRLEYVADVGEVLPLLISRPKKAVGKMMSVQTE